MTWKQVSNADVGDADHVGGNDWDKLSQAFSGSDVDDFDIACDFKVRDDKFQLADSDNSHKYIFSTGNLTADRTINIPVLSGTATLPFLEVSNNFAVRQEIRLTSGDEFLTLYKNAIETGTINMISWEGQDSLGNNISYVEEYCHVTSNTDGAEEGAWALDIRDSGTMKNLVWFDPTGYYFLNVDVPNAFGQLVFDNITADRSYWFPDIGGDIAVTQNSNFWEDQQFFGDRNQLENTFHIWHESPTSLSGNTNNYNPTNLDERTIFRISSSTNVDLTGIDDWDDKVMAIMNTGSNNITLKDQSTSSNAENRFALSADQVLGPNHSILLYYDATSDRWRSFENGTARLPSQNIFTDTQTIKKASNLLFIQYRNTNTVTDGIDQEFHLNSSTGTERMYGRIKTEIETNTDGAEDGVIKLGAAVNGAITNFVQASEATGGTGALGVALGGQANRVIIAPTGMTANRTFTFPDIGTVGGQNPRVKTLTHDYFEQADEFSCGSISLTNTSNQIGTLNWGISNSTGGTPTVTTGGTSHPGIVTITTGATSGNNCRMHLTDAAATAWCIPTDIERYAWIVRIPTITSIIVRLGLMQDVSAANGGTAGAFFQFSSAVDADNWQCITRQASTSTTNTITGVTVDAGDWFLLEAVRLSGNNWEFYVNNTLQFTHSANQPSTACNMGAHTETATTAARPLDIDYFHVRTNKMGQRWT